MNEVDDFALTCIQLENRLKLILKDYESDRVKTAVLIELLIPIIQKQDNPKSAYKQMVSGMKNRLRGRLSDGSHTS